ncbi:helix-turn-helix domain-containing protein [Flagellimonas algicola]|uniref:Helix-turn-helix domain-containing protein n=1 Tax=Flagellimonas algicola TaxID=2583815 RepID=A0ABY2WLH5_9FLAO|nr:AraC family transcriptional regulator [Allomuricauda algicola]TMU55704.1 helix-turn-helix domain-containing protein [Allomuricauda algicola]
MKEIPIARLHHFQEEPHLLGNFIIRDITILLEEIPMVQELHRHDFYFVLALEHSSGQHHIDFTPYPVGDHCVFFMRPGQVHDLTLDQGSTGFVMQFTSDFFDNCSMDSRLLLRSCSNTTLYSFNPSSYANVTAPLHAILDEFSAERPGHEKMIKAQLDIFLIELLRQQQAKVPKLKGPDLYPREQLEVFLELLETHLGTHKKVSDYAEMLNLSAYQLNSITKAGLGKTCSQVINDQMILESKRMLLATSNQVKEIAYALGYEDVSYFIRFFKKHTGHSPDAYRQNFA